mgnify:CR=1 FL=1
MRFASVVEELLINEIYIVLFVVDFSTNTGKLYQIFAQYTVTP